MGIPSISKGNLKDYATRIEVGVPNETQFHSIPICGQVLGGAEKLFVDEKGR